MTDSQDGSGTEFLLDAFNFVTGCVLPSLEQEIDGERFRLLVHPSARYDAAIIPVSGRFEIVVNDGVVTGLMQFCQTYTDLENPLLKSHVKELGAILDDEDRVLGISFYTGLVFLILHEIGHAAAGHVGFIQQAENEFKESGDHEESFVQGASFRQMAELEADGIAMALLFEFRNELMTALECPIDKSEAASAITNRAMLLGVVAAVSLLDGMFARDTDLDKTYPYPAVRLLNLCSAYLRVTAPDIVQWRGEDYWINSQDEQTIVAITDHFKQTIGPALFILHDALRDLDIASELQAIEDRTGDLQDFMSDALLVLGGGTPCHSVDGRELSKLTEGRTKFLKALAPFRELDLWHAVGGENA
ncbi:MAG: hypothetical protein ABJR46_16530 [Tateyamaria sp.]|uniref:hypothetical protein n=1 Tax=Tateyamaria sp. TaxID=1929288 RepID=UPI00329E038A